MFRPFKRPLSGDRKEPSRGDTQLKYVYMYICVYIYIYIYIYTTGEILSLQCIINIYLASIVEWNMQQEVDKIHRIRGPVFSEHRILILAKHRNTTHISLLDLGTLAPSP